MTRAYDDLIRLARLIGAQVEKIAVLTRELGQAKERVSKGMDEEYALAKDRDAYRAAISDAMTMIPVVAWGPSMQAWREKHAPAIARAMQGEGCMP